MNSLTLNYFFQSSFVIYLPLSIVAIFAVLFIPSLLVSGAKPERVARAISCYMMKTVGLFLVALSAVQLTEALINGVLPEYHTLSAQLALLSLGIGILVYQSQKLTSVDEASLMVPRLVFSHMCELLGGIIALIAAISIIITFMMTEQFIEWEMYATMFLLGMTLMLMSSIHIEKRNKKANRVMKKKK